MEFLISKEELKKVDESQDLLETITNKIFSNASKDFIACFVAGCTMDIKMEDNKFKLSTRYPVSILKHPNGDILSVVEKRV